MSDEKAGSNHISPELVNSAPEKMPEIVRSMHATAAQSLEDAADMLEQEMQSHIRLMRDEAANLRSQGDSQANTIEALSVLIRDTHKAFRVQADKLASFRMGELNGAQDHVAPVAGLGNVDLSDRIAKELYVPPRGQAGV